MAFLVQFISILFQILSIAIIGRALISWLNLSPGNPIVQFLYQITEPILGPIRRALPATGGIDLSPIVALLLLEVLRMVIVSVIVRVG